MSDRSDLPSDRVFADLLDALTSEEPESKRSDASLDFRRRDRTGIPEIILADGKNEHQVIEIARAMLKRNGRVLLSRVDPVLRDRLTAEFNPKFHIECPRESNVVRISTTKPVVPQTDAVISVFTAGTSDLPRAEEIRLVAEEIGCRVEIWPDVGVAGIHRLVRPLREAIDSGTKAIIVVAGMDGALPSVVAGLSPVPVIGLPSSVGYGFGGGGEAALMSMLQTCAPGLTVVNIDNSVGAAVAAARIAQLACGDRGN
jgi:pyridinium-3,5-biscarboxylic acid mononucleotide synthase